MGIDTILAILSLLSLIDLIHLLILTGPTLRLTTNC